MLKEPANAYRLLIHTLAIYSSFISPVAFLLSAGYSFDSASYQKFQPCHYALKYSPIDIFKRLHQELGMPIDTLTFIGVGSNSGHSIMFNLAEYLMALDPPVDKSSGVFTGLLAIRNGSYLFGSDPDSFQSSLYSVKPGFHALRKIVDSKEKMAYLKEQSIVVRAENKSAISQIQRSTEITILDDLK